MYWAKWKKNQTLTQVSQRFVLVSFCLIVIRWWLNVPTGGHGHVICMGGCGIWEYLLTCKRSRDKTVEANLQCFGHMPTNKRSILSFVIMWRHIRQSLIKRLIFSFHLFIPGIYLLTDILPLRIDNDLVHTSESARNLRTMVDEYLTMDNEVSDICHLGLRFTCKMSAGWNVTSLNILY